MADVQTKFKAALDVIQNLPKNGSYKPSSEMMLSFYSYYKQATEGRCNRAKPWSFDVINKAKWEAWNKLGSMSKEVAMENYVKELLKVMKDFPQPTNEQIIEALPASDEAANFIQTLGHFYEIVEIPNGAVKPTKKKPNLNSKETDPRFTNGNGRISNNHENGISTPISTSNGFHHSDDNSSNGLNHLPNRDVTDREKQSTTEIEADHMLSESDDEFCDTSAEINQALDDHENSGSHSPPSSISGTSFSDSSPRTKLDQNRAGTTSLTVTSPTNIPPLSRGGEKGTHGVDCVMDPHLNTSAEQRIPLAHPQCTEVGTSRNALLSGLGGAGEGNPPDGADKQSMVQERIAVALLQLQRDMHSVLNRLTTLETITIARNQDAQHCTHCCKNTCERKSRPWWAFDDLSPRTTLFILLWPFLARWLFSLWRRSLLRRSRH